MSAGDSPHPDVLAELNLIDSIGELAKLGLSHLPVQGTTTIQSAVHREKRSGWGWWKRWLERGRDSERKTKALQ